MEEDTNLEGSAPASPGVHPDAVRSRLRHGSISRVRLIDGGETACNDANCGLRAMCVDDSSDASASGPVVLDAIKTSSEDAIGATHLDVFAQLHDGDESAVAMSIDERQRGPIQEKVVVRTDFLATLKAQRSRTAYKKTLRCSPDLSDALNTQYAFDIGLAVLFTYYGNGSGIDGDGIGGAAAQLGMSRTVAGVYIKRLEDLLYDMMPDVIYFPAPSAVDEWDDLVEGFVQRGSDFPDVACVFDGTIIHTRRPRDHMVSNAVFGY
ncbi:hypothetical protein PHYSODRAFT_303635 [Phytophthora sojae]|uniref:Uncharacterized protein n=1 Tax=Phytophthora sojae (strain P6497) TaxID=1094619 RepID=G4ZWI4_PHYSP|nr:hypothetical protein PHYSODRAFT_303635 [Phytophthora sojae]EGZ11658.1 hypothetical protein PHYSODRAFT_303635 [Phytophthora sojae]|eukprot:XP_009531991.1 hypothetical protein PHYSODRAFT_303635 [Phytophthora sojae]